MTQVQQLSSVLLELRSHVGREKIDEFASDISFDCRSRLGPHRHVVWASAAAKPTFSLRCFHRGHEWHSYLSSHYGIVFGVHAVLDP